MNSLSLHIWSEGDYSVGIPGSQAIVELGEPIPFSDKDTRKYFKAKFFDIFSELWDTTYLHIQYSDTCDICGDEIPEGKKNCGKDHESEMMLE
jgi:hypothetical protein